MSGRPDLVREGGVGWRRSHGQALVESAIVFPILVAVAIGLVQFALYYHSQNVVIGSVQEGARLAAAEDRTLDEGVAYTRSLLEAGLGPSATNVSVRGDDAGDVVVVEARGQLQTVIPWVAVVTLPLGARASVHKEHFQAGPGG